MRDVLSRTVKRLGQQDGLDRVAGPLGDTVGRAVPSGPVKDALSGVWLGHPLHPMLTDLPIGLWTSAFVLDFVGGRGARKAATRLVGFGVVSALPAVLAGASDWGDTTGPNRRVGFVHAVANAAAVACYGASWWQRHRDHRLRGVTLGLAGAAAATVGGYLGGHLLQEGGVGVDNTAFETPPDEWTALCRVDELTDAPQARFVDATRLAVFRRDGQPVALGGRCPHRGAPMDEGALDGDVIVCPWHGSRFRITDGGIERGPSAMPLPVYDCRVRNGDVEVRAAGRA